MEIQVQKNNDISVINVSGKLDAYNSTELEKKITEVIDSGETRLIVNFDRLDYISSSGLRVLLVALKKLKKLNGDVKLACLKPFIKDVFDISGFTQLFTITENVDRAVASFL
jgi:anti-sigma B factor antagonist